MIQPRQTFHTVPLWEWTSLVRFAPPSEDARCFSRTRLSHPAIGMWMVPGFFPRDISRKAVSVFIPVAQNANDTVLSLERAIVG